jgi:hypothetical protein
MLVSKTLTPIPWAYSMSDFGSIWKWDTPAFIVTVNGDMKSFYWTIADKTSDPSASPRPFSDGQASTFEQAEKSIRETIGKAYPPALGYQHFAGHLATTFMIGTGEQIDLGVHVGRMVSVRVASPDSANGEEVYRGKAKVEHYEFIVVDNNEAIRIPPSYILEVVPEGPVGVTPVQRNVSPVVGRTVQGAITPGCTGQPGFLPNTVEHNGPMCPVHE